MEQPNIDIQRELSSIAEDRPTEITIPNTKDVIKVSWLKKKTIRKISDLMIDRKGSEDYVLHKAVAYIVLNGYFKIKFFHWALWRWYGIVKQYEDYQMLPIIECAKKKVLATPYYISMVYLSGLKDTLATMTREEVEHSLHEHSSGHKG